MFSHLKILIEESLVERETWAEMTEFLKNETTTYHRNYLSSDLRKIHLTKQLSQYKWNTKNSLNIQLKS